MSSTYRGPADSDHHLPSLRAEALRPSRLRRRAVGVRPFRRGSFRLDLERLPDGRLLGHSYGHGGSGITLCWGVALDLADLIEGADKGGSIERSALIAGAGVIGLCTAWELTRRGYSVEVAAHAFPTETTSAVAGGLWAPTHLQSEQLGAERYARILERSWRAFEALEGERYGVRKVPLYESLGSDHPLDPMPESLTGPPSIVERLPGSAETSGGRLWHTWLVETPRFLNRLKADLEQRGAIFRRQRFEAREQLVDSSHKVIVNCLGLGAGPVLNDRALVPIRGDLLFLDPLPESFIVDHDRGYIISRPDLLILGGSFLEGVEDLSPCWTQATRIWNAARAYLGAPPMPLRPDLRPDSSER